MFFSEDRKCHCGRPAKPRYRICIIHFRKMNAACQSKRRADPAYKALEYEFARERYAERKAELQAKIRLRRAGVKAGPICERCLGAGPGVAADGRSLCRRCQNELREEIMASLAKKKPAGGKR